VADFVLESTRCLSRNASLITLLLSSDGQD